MEDAFVIGYGMVGKATARALDIPYFFSRKEANITLAEGAKKQFCIICLPTPTDEKGGQGASVQVILDYIKQIQGYGGRNIFVVRSTVIPGTCRYLASETGAMVVHNPEFLSEDTAYKDAVEPRMKVIGSDKVGATIAVRKLWQPIRAKIEIETDTVTSEMIKYTFNTFAALKVVFANQIYDACKLAGANYDIIYEAIHKHPWGSKEHFRVIDKNGRGAGGRCLPKDLKAFSIWSDSKLLKTVDELNRNYLALSHKE